jgi:Uma2 family endonuclease
VIAPARQPEPDDDADEVQHDDQRVFLFDVRWRDYKRLLEMRGESAVPRMTYLDGVLELGDPHESDKTKLARLLEACVDHLELQVDGVGSWTVRNKKKRTGAEPDECYVFGRIIEVDDVQAPDLVIEVVFSSGGHDRLEVWRRLGAKEVWFWTRERKLEVFARRKKTRAGWERVERSELCPAIDLELIVRCMSVTGQSAAVGALRAAIS